MTEQREYGLQDGYEDARGGRTPLYDLSQTDGDEYQAAYGEGYELGRQEREDGRS
jgi:hypothetical protein